MSGLRFGAGGLVAAPAVGLLWWLLAPGGRAVVTDRLASLEAPGAQDAWFAVLGALAGLVLAVSWVASRPEDPDRSGRPVTPSVVGLLVGSLAGAVLAWGIGRGVDVIVDAVARTGADAAPAVHQLVLSSPAALLVWPFVAGLVVAADAARDLMVTGWTGRPRHSAPRGEWPD